MKPAAFEYHLPTTVEETLALLSKFASEDGRILAGGQSLVPTMAFRLARPQHLVDINNVASLHEIKIINDALVIGACARHADFHKPVCEGALGKLLSLVVKDVAHYPIRMRGTFCGSIAHADPASEWCLVSATLDATMVAQSTRGERKIPANDFFETVMTTTLTEDELLREVRLPMLPSSARFGFEEFNRRAGDFGIAMVLTVFSFENGTITNPRVGVGGAEDRPRRIAESEEILNGQIPSDKLFRAAGEAAAAALDPMEDHQTSGKYRRDLVAALTRRALSKAIL